MPEYDNRNRGAIWRNEKADGPNDPDFTGKLDVEGRQYRVRLAAQGWRSPEHASLALQHQANRRARHSKNQTESKSRIQRRNRVLKLPAR